MLLWPHIDQRHALSYFSPPLLQHSCLSTHPPSSNPYFVASHTTCAIHRFLSIVVFSFFVLHNDLHIGLLGNIGEGSPLSL